MKTMVLSGKVSVNTDLPQNLPMFIVFYKIKSIIASSSYIFTSAFNILDIYNKVMYISNPNSVWEP